MANRLKSEIKKRADFTCAQEELYLNILRTGDRLQIHFERLFREFDLTPSQYNVLRILRGEGEPLPILEIASRTITAVPGITGLIDRLESADFVERRRCPDDRRVIYVGITAKGLGTLKKIDGPLAELHRRLLGGLTQKELAEAIRLMERCRAELE